MTKSLNFELQTWHFTKSKLKQELNQLFHDGGPYHIEINPLTSGANQRTGFYMIRTSVMKELKVIS